MANLLPNEIKQKQGQDFGRRKFVVAGFALGLLLLIILIIAVSFWINLFIRNSGLAGLAPAVKNELQEAGALAERVALLKKIETEAKTINSYWSEPLVSSMVRKALVLKPNGIRVSGLVVERGVIGKASKIALVGLASSRNDLVGYVNLLRQDKFFTKVDLPVESLISDAGGQFVINLEK